MSLFSQFSLLLLGLFILPFLIPLSLSLIVFLVTEFLIEPLMFAIRSQKNKPNLNWATTSGIIDSRVIKRRWYYMGAWERRGLPDRMLYLEIPACYVHIDILYLVDSKAFVIRPPLSFIDEFSSIFQDKAMALVAKYPSGKRVTIKYDPSNPQHATLAEAENIIP